MFVMKLPLYLPLCLYIFVRFVSSPRLFISFLCFFNSKLFLQSFCLAYASWWPSYARLGFCEMILLNQVKIDTFYFCFMHCQEDMFAIIYFVCSSFWLVRSLIILSLAYNLHQQINNHGNKSGGAFSLLQTLFSCTDLECLIK